LRPSLWAVISFARAAADLSFRAGRTAGGRQVIVLQVVTSWGV
jgi:hypothetical protein